MTMISPRRPTRCEPADESLWLLVRRDNRTQCFEFPPHTHKALVVGSCSNSDVRISEAEPVAFFLEREGSSIWLTPARPDAELRLDTLKIEGPRRIYTHGLVEFANVQLRFRVRDTPPTLRGDDLTGVDSDLSDPMSNGVARDLDDFTPTATLDKSKLTAALLQSSTIPMSPVKSVPPAALATKTIEVAAFAFDSSVDEATKKEEAAASVTTQAPVAAQPPNIKTQEMAPIQCPNAPPAVSAPKIDPYRTLEIAPIRPVDLAPSSAPSRRKLETLRQTTSIQLGRGGPSGETTEFDAPAVKPPVEQPSAIGSSFARSGEGTPERQDQRPMIVKAPTLPLDAAIESNPWFQDHGSDLPVSTSTSSKARRGLAALRIRLAMLGLLAKRKPVLVFGGAAIGSLVLVLFLAGAAKMLNSRSTPQTEPSKTSAGALNQFGTVPFAPVGVAPTSIPAEARTNDIPVTIAASADVAPAVGHLFAGRLAEAEQAYRELAQRFPGEPAFQSASRILARKNSSACRGPNPSKTLCPSVKP